MPTGIYVRTKEYREKMRESAKKSINSGRFKLGSKVNLGRKRPDMIGHTFGFKKGTFLPHKSGCECFRCSPKSGSDSPFWKGGIENKRLHWRQRYARKINAEGSYSLGEWDNLKTQYNFTCPCCHKSEPVIKLTVDHIIPLSRGGSNNIENIQPLCHSCNSRKNNRIIIKY